MTGVATNVVNRKIGGIATAVLGGNHLDVSVVLGPVGITNVFTTPIDGNTSLL